VFDQVLHGLGVASSLLGVLAMVLTAAEQVISAARKLRKPWPRRRRHAGAIRRVRSSPSR
jgi:hypothetical protein